MVMTDGLGELAISPVPIRRWGLSGHTGAGLKKQATLNRKWLDFFLLCFRAARAGPREGV